MKIKFILGLVFALLAITFYSCCKAGTGGNATVVCKVVNAGQPVNDAIVYIYYNSSKPPANISGFNDSKKTAVNGNTVTFTGLKCGTYYLYATAFDSAVSSSLRGGGPYSLLHSNRNKTKDAVISVSY